VNNAHGEATTQVTSCSTGEHGKSITEVIAEIKSGT